MRTLTPSPSRSLLRSAGFTMVELMITLVVLGAVMVVLSTVIYSAARSKNQTSNAIESSQGTRVAVEMIAKDLRNAGYGADRDYLALPQPAIAYIDSVQVLLSANLHGDGDAVWDTTAYDPTGTPKPFPLNGTPWAPPVKYASRAELIRWTLDVNNDGAVDAGDISDTDGQDAQRTRNPNDYMLVREIYADSSVAGAGNNGGITERVSLMRRPADGATPPLFTVYLEGSTQPWDWANGPVPPSRLADIERVVVRAVGTASNPDWRGSYAETEYQTEANVTRNVPNFGEQEYAVDGFVYDDLNANSVKDAGEPGVGGATVRLDVLSAITDTTGYYLLRIPSGTYVLRHVPPSGYASVMSPDTFVVTVGPPTSQNFADGSQPGGQVDVLAFEDLNSNGLHDAGEPGLVNVDITLDVTSETKLTDPSGIAQFFVPVGAYAIDVIPPVGYVVTTTHPYTDTMVDGDTQAIAFGLVPGGSGTLEGKVFTDNNRNGVLDAGESGVGGVWVGASPDGGITVVGYGTTNATGDYSFSVAANDPPATSPYYLTIVVPNGFFPTTATSLGPLLVTDGATLTGKNFGVASFQVIVLNASRVLSLASADLIEQDWSGAISLWDTKGHKDCDIVLGADAGGTDNIATWFNQYSSSPLFDANPTYTRNAPNSVLAMQLAPIDADAPYQRQDAVTGTRYTATGNFFVWFAQNTSGNLGYFSPSQDLAYLTADNGDVQALVLADVGNGSMTDIIVGTKSPTSGTGTIEVWLSNDAATPTFTRDEIYPPQGSIPGNRVGEVTAMAMADLDGDGDGDLIVGTKTSPYSGQLLLFENTGRVPGSRFRLQRVFDFPMMAVTALAVNDFSADGFIDVVVGGQMSASVGRLDQFQNADNNWGFALKRQTSPPGIVMSLASADLGGGPIPDIIMGYRTTDPGYAGGLGIYFMDFGILPSFPTDPSDGAIAFMVPALTVNNFNYGVNPSTPSPPYLDDFAAGIKTGPSTGALLVFIR